MFSQPSIASTFVLVLLVGASSAAYSQQAADDSFLLGVRNTEPVSAEQQISAFSVPEGFSVELVAAEPDIAKPMNLAFDKRGRLWVSSSLEYPFAAKEGTVPRDTIRILEDANGDGRADKVTVFADKLNIPIGLIPYGDGVICFSIPNIWYLRDTNGDDKCDTREVLYGPFDTTRDTHGMCNAFRRGEDGWIYACHGFNNRSDVAGRDGHRVQMSSGNTFRFRPDGSRIELYTQGQVNPFGMSIDRFGDIFTADCHTKPVTLLLPGGCYDSFGRAHDGLGYVPNVMEHLHGSTAIAALALGADTTFPAEYADSAFDGNVMTSRINRNTLKRTGSSIRAIEEPDLLSCSDSWFRPVDLVAGPDGALYISDFYNRIIGHYEVDLLHPGRDRFRGRIWRLSYRATDAPESGRAGYGMDLTGKTAAELLDVIRTAPPMQKLLARHAMADDASAETTDFVRQRLKDVDPLIRRFALRLLFERGSVSDGELSHAALDPDEAVRVHAFRALRDLPAEGQEHADASGILQSGFRDSSAMVRRAVVSAMSTHPARSDCELRVALLRMLHTTDLADVHLRHTIRMTLRDHLQNPGWFHELAQRSPLAMDRLVLADLSLAVKSPEAAEYVAANVAFLGVAQPNRLAEYLQFAAAHVPSEAAGNVVRAVRDRFSGDTHLQRALLDSMRQGFAQRSQQPPAEVRAWALDLAMSQLHMKSPDDIAALSVKPALGWSYVAHPDTPNGDNCWGITASRRAADGVVPMTLFSSFESGEQRTGIYRSDAFEPADSLSFFAAGHDGIPSAPLKKNNFIRLRDAATGAVLREASPARNDVAQKIEWQTADLKGRRAVIELVDGDNTSAYAWLAVGRFSDERLNPTVEETTRSNAAALIGDFQLHELRPALVHLMNTDGMPRASLTTLAGAVLKLAPDSRLAAVALVPSVTGATNELIQAAVLLMIAGNPEHTAVVLDAAFHAATSAEQLLLAEQLAADIPGAEALLRLMDSGRASSRLLLRPTVQQRLKAIGTEELSRRIRVLTQQLPSEDSVVEQLLATRRSTLAQSSGNHDLGKELFKKNCLTCHQVAGEGKQVGPNLDGIGNRGLDRVLEDLLAPNRNVDVAFRTTTVVTNEGKAISGLLKELEGNRISIVDSQAKETILNSDIIEERIGSTSSPMPTNFGETLSINQLQDLVAYMLAQGKVAAP